MVTLLLWFLMLTDPFFPIQGERILYGNDHPIHDELIAMMRGRLLVCCLKKGMTEKQVEKLLGPSTDGFMFGWVGHRFNGYRFHHITICFVEGKVDTFVVTRLTLKRAAAKTGGESIP